MDQENQRQCLYVNGEEEQITGTALTQYAVKPLPWKVTFAFTLMRRWVTVEFDPAELLEVFEQVDQEKPGYLPIDIVAHSSMEFSIRYDAKIYLLTRTKISLWLVNPFPRY